MKDATYNAQDYRSYTHNPLTQEGRRVGRLKLALRLAPLALRLLPTIPQPQLHDPVATLLSELNYGWLNRCRAMGEEIRGRSLAVGEHHDDSEALAVVQAYANAVAVLAEADPYYRGLLWDREYHAWWYFMDKEIAFWKANPPAPDWDYEGLGLAGVLAKASDEGYWARLNRRMNIANTMGQIEYLKGRGAHVSKAVLEDGKVVLR